MIQNTILLPSGFSFTTLSSFQTFQLRSVFSCIWGFSWDELHRSGRFVYRSDLEEHQTLSLSGGLRWHSRLRVPVLTAGYLALSSTDPNICDRARRRRKVGEIGRAINYSCEHLWQLGKQAHLTQLADLLMMRSWNLHSSRVLLPNVWLLHLFKRCECFLSGICVTFHSFKVVKTCWLFHLRQFYFIHDHYFMHEMLNVVHLC